MDEVIVFKHFSNLISLYQDSCMFHCKDLKCNGVLSKWIPHTKDEALEHVYNGIFLSM